MPKRKKNIKKEISFRSFLVLFLLLAAVAHSTQAQAQQVIDLTLANASETWSGAIFQQGDPSNAGGTGIYDSFYRLSGIVPGISGVNTDGAPVQFDTVAGSWTTALLLSTVTQVEIEDVMYREFFLDINQTSGASIYDVVDIQVYLDDQPDLICLDPITRDWGACDSGGDANLIFWLDSPGDASVRLDYTLEAGSGNRDMRMLIPETAFGAGPECNYGQSGCAVYVYLYSEFSGNDDGFEEWSTAVQPFVQMSKTATGSLEEFTDWTISKSVTPSTLDLLTGESGYVSYTIIVDKTVTQNNFAVTGNITMSVPSYLPDGDEFAPSATITSIADIYEGVPVSSITCPTLPLTLNPGDSATCVYTIELASEVTGINTATASVLDRANNSRDFSATATVGDFSVIPVGEPGTVDVSDTNGQFFGSISDGAVFVYGMEYTCDADWGANYNTAWIDDTGDEDSAVVMVNCFPANTPPVANDDDYNATEDSLLSVSAPGVLDGDTDADNDDLTAVLDSDVSYGVLNLSDDGSFTYDPAENYCGDDSFTYHANDGTDDSNIATVSITVACVNDLPEVTSVSLLSQTVDYSDNIATVTVVVTDIDNPSTTLAESGEPTASLSSLSLTEANPVCVTDNTLSPNPAEIGSVCTWTYDGQVLSPGDNMHNIVFTASDADGDGTVTGTHELTIEPEDATVMLDSGNDVAAEVVVPGGNSGVFSLYFAAYETDNPDFSHGNSADFGDLDNMEPFMTLIPVGPGSPQDGVCSLLEITGTGYGQEAYFQCDFNDVPVNTYEVMAAIDGVTDTTRYYTGSDDDVFTVFDPSLGFTTGGGWFYWPGTGNESLTDCGPDGYLGDKTNFGFNLNYNKKRNTAKGSVLVMRHTVDENCLDAGSFRVKSNAIEGMSLGDGEDGDGAYGWAAVAGKSTYREPGLDNEGNHPFLMYVEDHGQQGCEQAPTDEFWIEVKDKDGVVVLQLNGPEPAGPNEATDADDEPIVCGNIVVPHKTGKGGGGPGEPNPNKPPKG